MENKNKEGYPDPTAAEAIQAADKQPEKISCIGVKWEDKWEPEPEQLKLPL